MEKFFENFRKKHGVAGAGKKAPGTKTKKRRQ
jgi:hypothetical protein